MAAATLADLAADMGMTSADVSCISGLDESTVSRLWVAQDWLDRIKGRTLQKLISGIPGVAEYVVHSTVERRRTSLFESLGEEDLVVDGAVFDHLVKREDIPAQGLCNTLECALYVVRGEEQKTASYMARFWGYKQFRSFDFINQDDDEGSTLIPDITPLLTAGPRMLDRIAARDNSFHAIITQAILSYLHAMRLRTIPPSLDYTSVNRKTAVAYRGAMLGLITATGDLDAAERYCRIVERNALMSTAEIWAFATSYYDASLSTDFSLPKSLLLRGSAEGVMKALDTCNDAYFHYLVGAAIPLLLHRDATLGLRARTIRSAIRTRIEWCREPAARRKAAVLLNHWPAAA